MSDVLGTILGVVFLFGGFTLLIVWWPMFIFLMMGTIPIFLMTIGAGALIYYISQIRSKSESEKDTATFREFRME